MGLLPEWTGRWFLTHEGSLKLRIQMRAEIRKLPQELGITTVYVTHGQEEVLTLSDRVVVFRQGRVLQIGPP